MSSRVKLFLGGTVTYVAAVAIGYSYFKKPQPEIVNHVPHTGPVTLEDKTRHEIYAKNANKYDSGMYQTIFSFRFSLNNNKYF